MMRLLRPVTITDAMLVSSTAPETDHAAWSAATTYALGNRVIKASTHRIYESVQGSNLNHDPETDTTSTWWLDVGPTNRWAMFDQAVGSQTSQATPLTVVLEPGIVAGLALLDVEASAATVTMTSGAVAVYSATVDMIDGTELVDWYGYFFDAIEPRDTLVLTDLPAYDDGQITVTLTAAATARCGTLAVGPLLEIGNINYGAGIGIIDYSRKETDAFGVTTLLERSYARRAEVEVVVEAGRVNYVARALAAVRAIPCVWIGDTAYTCLIVYGFPRDWGININYPAYSLGRLTIEGLT